MHRFCVVLIHDAMVQDIRYFYSWVCHGEQNACHVVCYFLRIGPSLRSAKLGKRPSHVVGVTRRAAEYRFLSGYFFIFVA